MATFVLVHGAWVGGWCWRPVAQALRRSGHEVYTPTLTGLGERSHLINPNINLDTHISDVTNVIYREELSEVVLVGHSYGGMVITGVFDALSDKITALVYLDAFVPENGQSLHNILPLLRLVSPDGASTTAPLSAAIFGASPDVAAYVDARTTPHPTACFDQTITLGGGIDRARKKTYIDANALEPTAFTPFYDKFKVLPGWVVHTLPCTHLVQMDMPNELVTLLLQAIAPA